MMRFPRPILLASVLLHAAAAPLVADPRLTGFLLDAGHRPVPEAQVELVPVPSSFAAGRLRLDGRDLPPPQATARGDAQGRFSLTAPQAGVWKVVARAPGKVPMQYGPLLLLEAEELPPAELSADEGLRIRVAGEDGRPAAGTWVLASPVAEGTARRSSSGWRPEFRVGRTADDGSLTLPRTAGERLQVNVFTAAGSESAEVGPGAPPAAVTAIRLRPPRQAPVSLRVVQADGTPAGDLLVRSGEQAWPAGVTDAAGTVLLPLREGDKTTLRIVAPDGRQDVFSATRPAEGGTLTLTLAPAVQVAGKVVDAAGGKALPGAVVWSQADAAVLVRADGEGRYTVPVSRKGSLTLEARAPGFLPKRLTISATEIANGRAPTVALDRAGDLRGAVTGPEGLPLPGAAVEAVIAGAVGPRLFSPFDPVAGRSVTGTGGGFEIHRLKTGQDYELRVAMSGYFPAAVRALVPSGGPAAPLRVRLQKTCAVQGAVRDALGKPVAGVQVVLRPARRPGREERPGDSPETAADLNAATAESGERGRFSLPASPADEIDLEAGRAGYATARRRGIHIAVPCGAPFDLGTVVLQPGAHLAGRVVNRRAQAIAGAALFLADHLPSRQNWERFLQARKPTAVSGPDGSFAVDDLPAGVPQDLLVKADGYLPAEIRSVRLPGRGPLRVQMDAAAAFRGRVIDEAGEPVNGARIDATWQEVLPDDPWKRPLGEPILRDTRSDAEGRFEIPDAPAGTVSLAVTAQGFIPVEELEAKSPPDDPARELTLTLHRGARLEGRVSTPAGEPVAGARIAAGTAAGLTDAEGVYRRRRRRTRPPGGRGLPPPLSPPCPDAADRGGHQPLRRRAGRRGQGLGARRRPGRHPRRRRAGAPDHREPHGAADP